MSASALPCAQPSSACCSLASVKSKGAKKKRKRGEDNSDAAEDFSESDSELGKLFGFCRRTTSWMNNRQQACVYTMMFVCEWFLPRLFAQKRFLHHT